MPPRISPSARFACTAWRAACLQHNLASMRVLERVGFSREGFARSYLRINGRWQDHVLFALIETDPISLPTRALT